MRRGITQGPTAVLPGAEPIGAEGLHERATCSVEEAAEILGIGRSTAYAAARDGTLPTLRLSHRLLVPTAKLMVMLGLEREGK
jgi:excisionase family DNA binding protein